MAVGLRVRDPNGTVILTITDRITGILGQFNTGTSDGAISVPGFAGKFGWAVILDEQPSLYEMNASPIVTISGTTLSWAFPATSVPRVSCTVTYGVY